MEPQDDHTIDQICLILIGTGGCPCNHDSGVFSHPFPDRPQYLPGLICIRHHFFILAEQFHVALVQNRQPHMGMPQTAGPSIIYTRQYPCQTILTLKNADHQIMIAAHKREPSPPQAASPFHP